ncbi:MAG TPA: tetratricopeptide repeat protein [Ktedonobacteraceae bacterium]|jgi:tetratricopeptide (TPR) repeat protein/transcriptional regulator with XRE-family HTH domain|nr:tetratricopeptide repeat protein [Ktedonobacteraceae bacterium]
MKKATIANQRLREARELRGWSQKYIADQIGADHYYLSRWERGTASPSPYYRQKLCTLFGMNAKELGLLPEDGKSPEVRQTQDAPTVATQVLDPAIPTPTIDTARLVGRDDILADLKQHLCGGNSLVLTALNGLPGVGKTTLAVALANDPKVQEHFRDGILWTGLGPQPNVQALLGRWGTVLGLAASEMVKLTSIEAWTQALRSAIGMRTMLLVIDDAWKIEEALAFKIGGPHCAYLVTTRFPHLAVYFAGKDAMLVRELSEEEALILLERYAPQAVTSEPEMARALVRSVGGLPLALTLIGKYLQIQAYSGQTRRLQAALRRLQQVEERLRLSQPQAPLEHSPSLPLDKPVSLETVITVSDQWLDEQARTALRALSVFPAKPNTFSEEAALAVIDQPVEVLDTLTDVGLLVGAGEGRYTLHQIIADYARIHLTETAPAERLAAYFADWLEAHEQDYEELELENSNIVAALQAALELNRHADFLRGVNAFAYFLETRGLYAQAEPYLKQARQIATTLQDSAALATSLYHLGRLAQNRGDYAQAQVYLQEGLNLARESASTRQISLLLRALGSVLTYRGNYTQAEATLQESLTLARQIGDDRLTSTILTILGAVTTDLGNYSRAEGYLQEGLTLAQRVGDRDQTAKLLLNLGQVAMLRGDFPLCITYWQKALEVSHQIGYREGIAVLFSNLGAIELEQGNFAQAQAYLQEGLIVARQLANPKRLAPLLEHLGWAAREQGNYTEAETYLREALEVASQIEHSWQRCGIMREWGELHLKQQQYDEASTAFQQMLELAQGFPEYIGLALFGLARVAQGQRKTDEALRQGQESLSILEPISYYEVSKIRRWLSALSNSEDEKQEEQIER